MSRCKKLRCCRSFGTDIVYKPRGVPLREMSVTALGPDEFEALRLCDLEGLDQEKAGTRMQISRGTVQRLLASGRLKIIRALLERSALHILSK